MLLILLTGYTQLSGSFLQKRFPVGHDALFLTTALSFEKHGERFVVLTIAPGFGGDS
jgi:hypothetical protein